MRNWAEIISTYEETFPLPQQDFEIYQKSKLDLEQFLARKAESLIFRSRAVWAENGEKPTKYFFNLERARSAGKSSSLLIRDDGLVVTDLNDIMNEQYRFYQDLYHSDANISFECENQTDCYLSKSQIDELSQNLKIGEIKDAIMNMPDGKAPGIDGLPIEVYKVLWPQIGNVIYEAYIDVFENESMYSEAMNGVLNLIPKAGKDTRYLKNLRPITLLNVDYKIIEKVIAARIQKVLPDIINSDQSGFMKERQSSSVIRKVLDVIQICDNEDVCAFIMSLDYMKAFDRVEVTSILG